MSLRGPSHAKVVCLFVFHVTKEREETWGEEEKKCCFCFKIATDEVVKKQCCFVPSIKQCDLSIHFISDLMSFLLFLSITSSAAVHDVLPGQVLPQ